MFTFWLVLNRIRCYYAYCKRRKKKKIRENENYVGTFWSSRQNYFRRGVAVSYCWLAMRFLLSPLFMKVFLEFLYFVNLMWLWYRVSNLVYCFYIFLESTFHSSMIWNLNIFCDSSINPCFVPNLSVDPCYIAFWLYYYASISHWQACDRPWIISIIINFWNLKSEFFMF